MKKQSYNYFKSSTGLQIKWGRMPSKLIPNFYDQVYFFITNIKDINSVDINEYEKSINEILSEIRVESYDHGQELRDNHKEAPIFQDYYQVTLVNFFIRDSY